MDSVAFLATTQRETFTISTHSLYELYFVFTKPLASNGFGYTADRAAKEISSTLKTFPMLPEAPGIFPIWQTLVAKYKITNRPIFDAKLVASMIEYRVPRILTFNDADFVYFTEITALNPFDVLGIPRVK
jgi:hypothetical protein